MNRSARRFSRALVVIAIGAAITGCADGRRGDEGAAPSEADSDFCGPSFTALRDGCAYIPQSIASPTTLVYYAHGMFADGARPERELEIVKASADLYGFAVLAPRGRRGLCSWSEDVKGHICWPTRRDAVDAYATQLLGAWVAAEHGMEKSIGMRFSRHYALGFSNGGYFIAYVAADGLLTLDGAAIVGAGRTDIDEAHLAKRPIPIFVGVGSDEQPFTLEAAARLAADLTSRGWPVDVTMHEGRGHELGEDDVDMAWLAWRR